MVRAFSVSFDALLLAIVFFLSWLTPALTRRDLLFGVTVAPDARSSPAGRAIIRRYRIQVIALGVLSALGLALLAVFASDAWWFNGWSTLLVLVPFVLLSIPYLLGYYASKTLRVTPQVGEAAAEAAPEPVAELRQRRYADYIPLFWEALPLAIIAATAIYLAISYAEAPAIIPIHFDAAGNPNGFANKTIGGYFLLVWVQLGMEALLTGLSFLIVTSKSLPGRAESRFRTVWLRYLFGMKVLTLAFMGALAGLIANAAQTGSAGQINVFLPITLVYVGILLVSAIILSLRTGQGGSRLGSPAETAVDRMNDRYWKLGGIYVNPQDPSFFVEKRFGVGWTINFGNRWGVVAMCGLLAVLLLVPILTIVLSASK